MKDEELDEVLTKAARAGDSFDPRGLRLVTDSIKSSIRPVHPLPRRRWILLGLFLVCAAVAFAAAEHAGLFGFQKMDIEQRLLIFPALCLLTLAAADAFVSEMIPGALYRVSSDVLLLVITLALAALFAALFRDYRTDHFFAAGIACLAAGLLYAAPAAVLCWLLLRRGFAVNPTSAGLAAGALAGLAGTGMLELHCPNFQAAHVLVWHIAVVPSSAVICALIARLASLTKSRIATR